MGEVVRFLVLKSFMKDLDAVVLSASPLIDKV